LSLATLTLLPLSPSYAEVQRCQGAEVNSPLLLRSLAPPPLCSHALPPLRTEGVEGRALVQNLVAGAVDAAGRGEDEELDAEAPGGLGDHAGGGQASS